MQLTERNRTVNNEIKKVNRQDRVDDNFKECDRVFFSSRSDSEFVKFRIRLGALGVSGSLRRIEYDDSEWMRRGRLELVHLCESALKHTITILWKRQQMASFC